MTVPERTAETAEALAAKTRAAMFSLTTTTTSSGPDPIRPGHAALAELVSRASDRDAWKHTAEQLAGIAATLCPDTLTTKERAALSAFRVKSGEATGEGDSDDG